MEVIARDCSAASEGEREKIRLDLVAVAAVEHVVNVIRMWELFQKLQPQQQQHDFVTRDNFIQCFSHSIFISLVKNCVT